MIIATPTDAEAKRLKMLKLDRACADDPALFFNTMLKTFNPKVTPSDLDFKLFPFQEELIVKQLIHAIENGYDIFFDKTREMGVSYTVLGVLLWYWKYQRGSNFLLGSRKEDYVDNVGKRADGEESTKEASLFGKLDYMIDRLPTLAKPTGFNPRVHRTRMSLTNPELGNNIAGESSNVNFSRGGRFKAALLDEFAFWENDDEAWGSTADTTRCRIVITTPGSRPGTKAKRLRFGTDGETIKVVELPYHLDPRKTDEWLENERQRRSREDFAREIMIDWEGSLKGVVYPEAKEYRKLGNFPYNPDWPLFVSWDFGMDTTAIQWWQHNPTNGKMRLVDAFAKKNTPIQWFFPMFPRQNGTANPIDSGFQYTVDELDQIEAVKWFKPATHYGDPDVSKRSMVTKTLSSNKSELANIGIYIQTNRLSNTHYERREKTKLMFMGGIEVNETPGITQTYGWVESIDYYSYPPRDDNSVATTEIQKPIHNVYSHHATSTEYLAVNLELHKESKAGLVYTAPPDEAAPQSFYVGPSQSQVAEQQRQQPAPQAPDLQTGQAPSPFYTGYNQQRPLPSQMPQPVAQAPKPSGAGISGPGVFGGTTPMAGYGGIAKALRESEYDY